MSDIVSIIGYHRSVMGLGEDARTLAETCLAAGYWPELVDVSPPSLERSRESARFQIYEAAKPNAATLVFCLPPGDMDRACTVLELGSRTKSKRRVGFWPWETSALPPVFDRAFDLVDELWASSTFLLQLYRGADRLPVRYMPHVVTIEPPALTPELATLLDGRFTILSVFDFHSRIARKNPLGAVDAFRRAFPLGDEPVQMLLKTINGDRRPNDLARLLTETFRDPRIAVVDGAIARSALCGLIQQSDLYLSLHRAEGFGRPVAEAMLLGTPVVATGWSGTSDFLTDETGYPVPSQLRPLKAGEYLGETGSWAEPDVAWAALTLARLYHSPADRRRTCDAAHRRVTDLCGLKAGVASLRSALMFPP